jgi:hypothetical protein
VSDADLQQALDQILHNAPDPGQPHQDFSLNNRATGQAAFSDPVIIASGQFHVRVADITIPSRGFPLQLVREYVSGPVSFGPWGYNWDHPYNMFVRELTSGDIAVWTGHFSEDIYKLKAGGYEPPPSIFLKLEKFLGVSGDPRRKRLMSTL